MHQNIESLLFIYLHILSFFPLVSIHSLVIYIYSVYVTANVYTVFKKYNTNILNKCSVFGQCFMFHSEVYQLHAGKYCFIVLVLAVDRLCLRREVQRLTSQSVMTWAFTTGIGNTWPEPASAKLLMLSSQSLT